MSELVAMSLSGGASKGAFEAGAIYYICGKLKVDPGLWTGTSVGALNSLAALHVPMGRPQELAEFIKGIWMDLKGNDDVYILNPNLAQVAYEVVTGKARPETQHSIMSTDPLWDLMNNIYQKDMVAASGRMASMVAVSLRTGDVGVWTEQDEDLLKGCLASAAMPVVFPAVEARGELWVDGGLRDVRPIAQALDRGATRIFDISTDTAVLPPEDKKAWSILDTALRTLAILLDEVVKNDVSSQLCRGKAELITIQPEQDLGDPLDFSPKHVREMFEHGYQVAKKVLG